jgi:hypothetical protein
MAEYQFLALQIAQYRPTAILRDRRILALDQSRGDEPGSLNIHFEEQKVRDLRDVGLIGHALVAQYMRVVPHLLDERGFVPGFLHSFTLIRGNVRVRFPPP